MTDEAVPGPSPALTPREWATLTTDPDSVAFAHLWMADGWRRPEDRHALAAIALHGHPSGFTAADVRLLRDVVERGPLWPGRVRALQALASRIAALLPPGASEAVVARCEWMHPWDGQCWEPAGHPGPHARSDPGGHPWSAPR